MRPSMLLARVLVLVAAVLAAPREEVAARQPLTNPYRVPFTIKDDNPIHFEDNLPKGTKQEYPTNTQSVSGHQGSDRNKNIQINYQPETNVNYGQPNSFASQPSSSNDKNIGSNGHDQGSSRDYLNNIYNGQQRPSNEGSSQDNYNQYKTNTNDYISSTNNDQSKPKYQYNNGFSLANTSTPLYVREPSRTRPVLKAEEVEYGLQDEPVVRYDGAQVWKVDISNEGSLRVIGDLSRNQEISSWGGSHETADFMIKPDKLDRVGGVLRRSGVRYNVVIDDLQRYIEQENPPLTEEELDLQDRKGHRMTWTQYHRLADIHGFLDFLANTYPSICSVMSIGKSYRGRDLKMLRISNGNPSNKAVLIDGGIHAREWISPATVTYFINEIVENYDGESETFRNLDWYIIPVLNPDGYEFTHTHDRLWRKNRKGSALCNGIDLNRNFGYKWGGKGTSNNPCSEIYAGAGAFSESESKALQDFVTRSSANFKLYATYHSYGEYILYPWGYDSVVPQDHEDLDRVAKQAAQAIVKAGGNQYKVGASSIVLYPAAGGSDDWAKAVPRIKYTYTIELSDKGQYGFVLPASYITKVAKESLAALRVMADAAIQA